MKSFIAPFLSSKSLSMLPLWVILVLMFSAFAGFMLAVFPSVLWLMVVGIVAGAVAVAVLIYPFLGLLLLVPMGMFLTGYYIGPMPIRYYVLLLLMAAWLLRSRNTIQMIRFPRIVTIMISIATVYLFWALFREASYTDIPSAVKTLAGDFIQGFLTAIFVLLYAKEERQLKVLYYGIAIWVFISAFVAVMQFLGVQYFIEMGDWVWQFVTDEKLRANGLLESGEGSVGLFGTTRTLGYIASYILPITLAFILISRKRWEKNVLFWGFIVLLCGLAATLVMSSLLGGLAAIGVVLWLWGHKKIGWTVVAILVIMIMVVFISYLFPGIFVERVFDQDGLARLPLAIVGLRAALDAPLGIQRTEYLAVAQNYIFDVMELEGYQYVTVTSPHNNFINVLTYYGFPGLFFYLAFYIFLWKVLVNLSRSMERVSELQRGLVIGLIGAFIVGLANSLTHNSGLFIGETFAWYGVGIVWALLTQQNINKAPEAISV